MAKEATEQELEALEAIYGQDVCPFNAINKADGRQLAVSVLPGAWKGTHTTQVVIRIQAQEDAIKDKVGLSLVLKLPQAYPKAIPEISFKNAVGVTPAILANLQTELQKLGKELKGNEAIYDLASFAGNFITERNSVLDPKPSLLEQLGERESRQKDIDNAKLQAATDAREEKARQEQAELLRQAKDDLQRLKEANDKSSNTKTADTANTIFAHALVPTISVSSVDIPGRQTQDATLLQGPELSNGGLGKFYSAEMTLKESDSRLQATMHVVNFETPAKYYATSIGQAKLHDLQAEIAKVKKIRHQSLLDIYAAEISGVSIVVITAPLQSGTILSDLLSLGVTFPAKQIIAFLTDICSGLQALHMAGLTHKSISSDTILLKKGIKSMESSAVIFGASYNQLLVDMNRSFAFSLSTAARNLPTAWKCPEAISDPLDYSPARDIYDMALTAVDMVDKSAREMYSGPAHLLQNLADDHPLANFLEDTFAPKEYRNNIAQCMTALENIALEVSQTEPKSSGKSVGPPSLLSPIKETPTDMPTRPQHKSLFWQPLEINEATPKSRYRAEFDEVEFLGRGGFGKVVKALNKLDRNFYAVKKVSLPNDPATEHKILREVTTWSRLSHPTIVRYHTAWVESETSSVDAKAALHDIESSRRPSTELDIDSDAFQLHLDDTDFLSLGKETSMADVHFGESDDSEATTADPSMASAPINEDNLRIPTLSPVSTEKRMLYLQMEYLAGRTLREAIDDGLSEEESWRILLQILQAMIHYSSFSIVHRDLKPHNIFLDMDKSVKLGDFGLAIGTAEQTDQTTAENTTQSADLTSAVGTSLYAAPEVLARSRSNPARDLLAPRVDCYSLGIILFEMVYPFSTRMERFSILNELRRPQIFFPQDWPIKRAREKEIITKLLSHDPAKRPLPAEILTMLPDSLVEASVDQVVRLMGQPRSQHKYKVLNALFQPPSTDARISDLMFDHSPATALNSDQNMAINRLMPILESRGAVKLDVDLLLPFSELYRPEEGRLAVRVLDENGNVLQLPYDHTLPLCRKVARDPTISRLKRYLINPVFRKADSGSSTPRQPMVVSYDIVSVQKTFAAEAECIHLVDTIISQFTTSHDYAHYIGHTGIITFALTDTAPADRPAIRRFLEIWNSRGDFSTSKLLVEIAKLPGVTRRLTDTLAALNRTLPCDDYLETALRDMVQQFPALKSAFDDLSDIVACLENLDIRHKLVIRPLLLVNPHLHSHGDGPIFQLTHFGRRVQTIAQGGRYDALVSKLSTPDRPCSTSVVGVSIALAHLTSLAGNAQEPSPLSVKDGHTRRCDVYIVSFVAGAENERLRLAALFWKNGIKADLMYEGDFQTPEQMIARRREENLLYCVIVKPPTKNKEPIYKVRAIMRSGEEEVARSDLVSYLLDKISEQSRLEAITPVNPFRSTASNRQVMLFAAEIHKDAFKRKETRQRGLIAEKALSAVEERAKALADDAPVYVVDVEKDALPYLQNSTWLSSESEAYNKLMNSVPAAKRPLLNRLREALREHFADEHNAQIVWLYFVRLDKCVPFSID